MTKVKQIKQLPCSTYRLLCSGQIITSVFSVVKELVENSLDSGCSSIDVKLENYGLDRIEVRDNGCGIHTDDIPHVVKSHYTSKISSFADLETLHTYGFRGEALGALCCIADVTICSKTPDEDVSRTYTFNNKGEIQTSKPSASPQGTTVIAVNLFKNIPVRKQIYKSEKTKKEEMKKIESFLCAFACSELGIRFALYHNRNVIWQKSAVNDIRSAMIQVYGSSAVNNMVPICSSDENLEVKLEGFFPKPDAPVSSLSHSNSDGTIVVINKRPVRIKEIDKVLLTSYSQSASFNGSKNRYPLCFISISLPPKKIDVNIEPNKTRVLLHSMEEILGFLSESIGKVCHTVLPEKRTELPAITNHKPDEISLSTDIVYCSGSMSDLSSEKSACKNGSPVISSNNTFYEELKLGNNTSKKETSKISHSIANGVSAHLIDHDHIVKDMGKLPESPVKHVLGNGISGDAKGGLFHPLESFAKSFASENIGSRSSALINDTFYPKYDSNNSGFKSDKLKIHSSIANHVTEPSRKAGSPVLKSMENLSENFVDLVASNQACGVAQKDVSFMQESSSDLLKYNDDCPTVPKTGFNTIGMSSTKYMVLDECLSKSSLKESGFTVLKPCNVESNGSVNNISSVNKSCSSAIDSASLLTPNTNLNDKVHKSIKNISSFSTSQGVQTILQPCGSESSSSVIHQTVVDTFLNSVTSVDNYSSELSNLPKKRTLNDFQTGLDFFNARSVQTVIVPCDSKLSSSSNNNASSKVCSNLPSGCVDFGLKGNRNSETVKGDKQNVAVLLESTEFDPIPGQVSNSDACDKKSILSSVSAAVERKDWCLGNLKDSEGKKIEPVAILTKNLIKRSFQEEDTILDVKRKKPSDNGDTDANASDFETKQPPRKSTLSAFGLFCRDFRLEVSLQNQGQSNQNIAKVLTERWNNLAPEEKVAYENRAKGNDTSCPKVKKKLGKTLSQTLGALNKKKKPVAQRLQTLDQVLIRKRKVNVVQFTLQDLKAKITLGSSKCTETNKDEKYSVISCLSPGSWICLKGCELLLLNSFRLREMLIYCRLMETYVFPSEKLNIPIALNDGVISDDDSLQVLGELVQDSCVQKRTLVADKRITCNGFKIRIGNDGHTASLVEMPSCLPFCGISDFLEILRHLKQKRENATVFGCRPTKAIHYLQGEAVRIVRQSPNNLRKDEVEDLLRKKESILAGSGSVCLHNKPFFHVLHKIDSLQNQECDFQDY